MRLIAASAQHTRKRPELLRNLELYDRYLSGETDTKEGECSLARA